jgi:hypothetical protein
VNLFPRGIQVLAVGVYGDDENVRRYQTAQSTFHASLIQLKFRYRVSVSAASAADSDFRSPSQFASQPGHQGCDKLLVRLVFNEKVRDNAPSHQ